MLFGGIFVVRCRKGTLEVLYVFYSVAHKRLFAAHGILSPIEEERLHLVEKLNARDSELTQHGYVSSTGDAEEVFMDECEILDWEYSAPELKQSKNDIEKYVRESSYKLVEMADDKKTPLRIRDGNFGMFNNYLSTTLVMA